MVFVFMTNEKMDENMEEFCSQDDYYFILKYLHMRAVSVGLQVLRNFQKYDLNFFYNLLFSLSACF